MPSKAKELTPLQVKRFESPGFYAVGGVSGLYLKVSPGGSRSWILRAMVGALRRDMGLGGYPDVSLAKARERAKDYRESIRAGIDPVAAKEANRASLIADQLKAINFRDAAHRCHAAKSPEFRNEKHRKDWISALERHAIPVIGSLPVASIDRAHILQVLEPIWRTKTETATRVRQRLESVLTWATVSGHRVGENPARWKGNLQELLPNPAKVSKVKHHPALPWNQVGQFMTDLRKMKGIAPRALEFAILTAARSGEVRGMAWAEVDFDSKVWTVPADRIKSGREHKVPLSDEAIAILKALPKFEGVDYIFPAPRGGMLSDVALLAVVRRMDVEAVPHGFRSSFKDWARSCTAFPDEVSELALAHVNNDATRAAYARDELLPKRALLMRDWGRFCNTVMEKGTVSPFRSQA